MFEWIITFMKQKFHLETTMKRANVSASVLMNSRALKL